MLKHSRFFAVIGVLGLTLAACSSGGGGGGGGNNDGGGGGSQLQSTEEGAAAAGAATSAVGAAGSLGSIGSALSGFGNKPSNPLAGKDPRHAAMVAAAKKLAASSPVQKAISRAKTAQFTLDPITLDCTTSGSYTFSGSIDDVTGDTELTLLFEDCLEGDELTDGTMTMTITTEPITDPNDPITTHTVMDIQDLTYTTLVNGDPAYIFVMDVVMDINSTSLTVVNETTFELLTFDDTYDNTTNGTMTYTDNVTVTSLELSMVNLTTEGTTAIDYTAGTYHYNDTLNGEITETFTAGDADGSSVEVVYDDFVVDTTGTGGFLLATALSHEPGNEYDLTYDGTITIDFAPDDACIVEGAFTFETVEPIHQGLSDSCPVAGLLRINSGTDIQYNSDGSVDVTVGSDSTHFDDCFDLNACEVEDFGG